MMEVNWNQSLYKMDFSLNMLVQFDEMAKLMGNMLRMSHNKAFQDKINKKMGKKIHFFKIKITLYNISKNFRFS